MRVHISLDVSSIDQSKAFYSALFGQAASKVKSGYANFRLDEPPIHLALMERGTTGSKGVGHLGVELPDKQVLGEWHSRLQARGVKFSVEDNARCCYATADKLWLTDPDGHRWEIWVRTGEYDSLSKSAINEPVDSLSNHP